MAPFTDLGTENLMRWDRRSASFMEVWYATATHVDSGLGLWVRYTITAPDGGRGEPYCEVWGFLFDPEGKITFGAKERFSTDRLGPALGRDDGAIVRIGDSWLSETQLEGRVGDGERTLTWSLAMDPARRCFQHLPLGLHKRLEKRASVVCSPNLSVPLTGSVELDGRSIRFDDEPGCQSHRWGRRHPVTWAWAHCSRFDDDKLALFEGVAARPDLGIAPGPTATFAYLNLGGEDLAFNELKWALRAKSRYEMPTWAFTARNERWRIAGAARLRVDRSIQVEYRDPDGSPRYCTNSEIGDIAVEVYARTASGWRHETSLTSLGGGHVEFGRREPFEELPVSF